MIIWVEIIYLLAAVLFIVGIKAMTRPKTAVRGNLLSAVGMLLAVVVTLLDRGIVRYEYIAAGLIAGALVGATMAMRVRMTAMPQMVALLNGCGGAASLALAIASQIMTLEGPGYTAGSAGMIAVVFVMVTILIGAVTLSGSLVAFAKLQELISGQPIGFAGMKFLNAALFAAALGATALLCANPGSDALLWTLVAVALLLGLTLVLPIGGADMPVVIALLNSYSGIAAATAGFIMENTVLIVSGSLVGASGLILTQIMCKAMNRSLTNVLFGVMAPGGAAIDADAIYAGKVKSAQAEEIAMILETARRVVIVPGFGMAMSQAQHAVRELMDVLEDRGTEVEFAIHPVAGRMPGHMNVLLAEAEVPYDKLVEMDRINPTFEQTDVAIVIGANDVTNPMAREDKGSPIYGMPILNVDKARTVVVVKRSLGSGFAGLPNPLFARDNCLMVFGDGKKAVIDITAALNVA
ncbi:MAG: NAD(P)(+) transhydrogenase (Re/Si-specific) subunit beta [Pseudomonadales bacterium]|nr:NAD(P)(+) transhydrogenase (Re/Si-specific) subunit beta [Pseudomonadales bacterium]